MVYIIGPFGNDIKRPALYFIINSADVLPQNTQANKLNAAKK